jgi:hypothetical protein
MLKLASTFDYGPDMDEECIELCNAFNSIKGIYTSESCCGHGKSSFEIYFSVTDWIGLFFLTRCVDRRYWKHGYEWGISLLVGDRYEDGDILPTQFWLSSKLFGEGAYAQTRDLVDNMNHHLNNDEFMEYYNIPSTQFNVIREDS